MRFKIMARCGAGGLILWLGTTALGASPPSGGHEVPPAQESVRPPVWQPRRGALRGLDRTVAAAESPNSEAPDGGDTAGMVTVERAPAAAWEAARRAAGGGRDAAPRPAGNGRADTAPEAAARPRTALEATILARPLFDPSRRPDPLDVPVDDLPVLTGVVREGAVARGVFQWRGGAQGAALAPGEAVDGWRLLSLTAEAATLVRDGRRITLRTNFKGSTRKAQAPEAASAEAR